MDKLYSILEQFPLLDTKSASIVSSMKRISKIKKWSTAAFTPQKEVVKVKNLA
jgi:hypothetical protein